MRRGHEGRLAALGRAGLQRAERDSGKVRARMCMAPRVFSYNEKQVED